MSLKFEVYYDTIFCRGEYHMHWAYHRKNGPAVIARNRELVWYQYGKLHRDDGPAYVGKNHTSLYFIRGNEYKKEDYESKIPSRKRLWSYLVNTSKARGVT